MEVASDFPVLVRNLPIDQNGQPVINEDLFCEKFGVNNVVMKNDQINAYGRHVCYAIVSFNDLDDAKDFVSEFNYSIIQNFIIVVELIDEETNRLKEKGEGIIVIQNLDELIDPPDIYTIFSEIGEIIYSKFHTYEKSSGWVMIQYRNPSDASKAIKYFNGYLFNRKQVSITLYRKPKVVIEKDEELEKTFTKIIIENIPKNDFLSKSRIVEKYISPFGSSNKISLKCGRRRVICEMKSHEEAVLAVNGLNEKEFDGKLILCRRFEQSDEYNSELHPTILCISNLPNDVTERDLILLFHKKGNISYQNDILFIPGNDRNEIDENKTENQDENCQNEKENCYHEEENCNHEKENCDNENENCNNEKENCNNENEKNEEENSNHEKENCDNENEKNKVNESDNITCENKDDDLECDEETDEGSDDDLQSFALVTFETLEDAILIIDSFNHRTYKDRELMISFADDFLQGEVIFKDISQYYLETSDETKINKLLEFFRKNKIKKSVIFASDQNTADEISTILQNNQISTSSDSLSKFIKGESQAYVAAEIVSFDFTNEEVPLIILFDVPKEKNRFLAKIGFGCSSKTVLYLCNQHDLEILSDYCNEYNTSVSVLPNESIF
ncbi:hypothetical protein TRFO_35843 [Tritrichomonas foetus]|uniref:RRM domain-containing protein n=1 Tax=Tritrichomonas foetus TaxID=1144522 RepID=A0A1J4JF93_9EUKA|nr:hypothetical protein TRFO_35843 [Tritrichomonas foetus]|eukprot:OHS97878.1 hypothetical protein TRFO_35843 [Tritrichomonas foetus]